MQPNRANRKIVLALCLNAFLLLLILLAVVSRGNHLNIESAAFAQMPSQPGVAGGSNSIYVMPAQLSPNTWGCYLLDNQNQTLSVYQYSPGEKLLRFAAGRNIENDRRIGNFNTLPAPSEVKELVTKEQDPHGKAVETPEPAK